MKLMRAAVLAFLLFSCFKASGGWFTPSPQEVFYKEYINVIQNDCITKTIRLDERSTYMFVLRYEEAIDFHSEIGREIEWPIDFEYKFQIFENGKLIEERSDTEPLDHAVGAGLATLQAPKALPIDRNLDLKLCFLKVGGEFNRVYKDISFMIIKSPYIWLTI